VGSSPERVKKGQKTINDQQNATQKIKIKQHEPNEKLGVNSGSPEE
jgi:hypothetical protein